MEAEVTVVNKSEESQKDARRQLVAMILLGVAALAVVAASTQLAIGLMDDPVVARADDITLKRSDLEALLSGVDPAARQQLVGDTAALSAVVRRELGRRLLQQRALAENWHERDEVQEQLERLRLEYIATSFLEAQSAPPESFPSETEIETAYQLNQQRLLTPRQFRLAQIWVRRPADAAQVAEARRTAETIAAEVRKQPDRFARLAREKSDDVASAGQGGELGWLPEDQIQPAVRAVAMALAPGDVSEPVEMQDGWHILRMLDTRPAAVASLAQARPSLVAMLRQQRAQENAAAYLARIMSEKQAAVDEITLAKAQKDLQ